ncbi:MAG: DUF1501 domain-containing protein, partial [Planctomycetia bacterium]
MNPADTSTIAALRGRLLARRWFFGDCGVGLAGIAAGALAARESSAAARAPAPLAVKEPHHAPRAKRVIYMFQAGAPSHLELYDWKPALAARDGTLPPASLLEGYRAAFINPNSALLGPKYKFQPYGKSGIEMSELVPHIGAIADDICLIRSMQTDAVNHAPAQILTNTGSQQFGRPSFGAWTLYGLGSEAENLPGFVVLTSAKGTSGGASNYGSGFLPTSYGGIPLRSSGDPVLYLSNPRGIDRETQRASLDTLGRLNEMAERRFGDPETASRIQAYDLASRLQQSAPELMNLADEPKQTLARYGIA